MLNSTEHSNRLLTVSCQQNPKSVKTTLQKRSAEIFLSNTFLNLSMYKHNIFTHNDKYIVIAVILLSRTRCLVLVLSSSSVLILIQYLALRQGIN